MRAFVEPPPIDDALPRLASAQNARASAAPDRPAAAIACLVVVPGSPWPADRQANAAASWRQDSPGLIEPRFRGLFVSLFALFTLFGMSMTVIGATLPKILANFRWNT